MTKSSPINYQDVYDAVKDKHENFVSKNSLAIEKTLSDFKMYVDLTYARISFIAKILMNAKVIEDYKEIDVLVEGTTFLRSVVLYMDYEMSHIYLLNAGKSIFIYEGVASENPGNLSFLVWTQNEQTKKINNVLDEHFDWKEFALTVLEAIHKSSYKRKEIIDNVIGV